ncbi:hypothetical protein [Phyllobacterium sp. SB3]|uniref:plasmid mobilization protein n=1 Tax=Phyllobacterium sp. SB3 TaxID=3156073 RepID=UPI0032AF5C8B
MSEDKGHTPPSPGGRKRRGGRPLVPDAERRRRSASIRFSPAESLDLAVAAGAAGLTLSAYLRARVLGHQVRGPVPELNRNAYSELARTTANLNQIAAHLNGGGAYSDDLRRLLESAARETRGLRLALLGISEDRPS